MSIIDEITNDLNWRETELGLLKILLQRNKINTKQHQVIARAAWALLYAHYEGFSKFCLTIFFDYAKRVPLSCDVLPEKTKYFALGSAIKKLRNADSIAFLRELTDFVQNVVTGPPTFPDVDTESNLWPSVLEKLLEIADIDCPALDKHRVKIKTLVGRRNKIAHGEQDIIANYDYYVSYEVAVYEVMYELAFQVEERLKRVPYV